MKITKCPPPVEDVTFLQGHLYQGKQMKVVYLCIEVTDNNLRLVDLEGAELKSGNTRSLYDDVTDRWELKESCGVS